MTGEPPRLPPLTSAESAFVDRYLAVVDALGRVNPARAQHTYGALRAAQRLVREAEALRDALATMHERGETEVFSATLTQAVRELDGVRRTRRLILPEKDEQ
ncbi:hypothetical protein [Streptomyces thermodiastaticus]|jgi:hypothetical protein|uniref:hypothetical protein n=1 Tax=Streptomyces thermodiastaticus TaxID=44061 RepID=UPI0016758BA0|nr:hypothetical protein [Streptomyces thermodiastaticus]MCE7551965.1 hypothetical protein [Streptomyces thermodiastaticus]GHE24378.1 hypothetical protein GCM10018787_54160 [Streptomyces thermodiastaticus]